MKVLVVEDDHRIADFVVRGLREEGFIVDHVVDAPAADHCLRSDLWDVILLDWRLPGGDGLRVLQEYRARGGASPVLFLTARDSVADRVRGLDSGADDYLCKPFSFAELLARVRALARRKDQWSEAVVRFADVTVELASHTVLRGGRQLDLTTKEEALLLLLLGHPGRVFSRTQLYEQVWDERYDGLSNTLEVHVMSLRRKLETAGPRLIHTLRGRGYVLDVRDVSSTEGVP